MRINIKPLSVNKCFRSVGNFTKKSSQYREYEKELFYLLPTTDIPDGNLAVEATFGVSNKQSDLDNLLKPFLDVLQKKYEFNDSRVYALNIKKEIVSRGQEFIDFEITEYLEQALKKTCG